MSTPFDSGLNVSSRMYDGGGLQLIPARRFSCGPFSSASASAGAGASSAASPSARGAVACVSDDQSINDSAAGPADGNGAADDRGDRNWCGGEAGQQQRGGRQGSGHGDSAGRRHFGQFSYRHFHSRGDDDSDDHGAVSRRGAHRQSDGDPSRGLVISSGSDRAGVLEYRRRPGNRRDRLSRARGCFKRGAKRSISAGRPSPRRTPGRTANCSSSARRR